MQWQEIRKLYPHTWLVVEALSAHSVADKRILDQLAVLNSFEDSAAAFHYYSTLHRESRNRELYVLHTDRANVEIMESRWMGLRGS